MNLNNPHNPRSSERRREGRYQRRKLRRMQKKHEQQAKYDNYERVCSFGSLLRANTKSLRGSIWKTSVQAFQYKLLKNTNYLYKKLQDCEDISRGFVEFDLMERGKIRHIRSVHYSERVVQRSMCDNALVPVLKRKLIYDNGACLPKKGVQWAMNRVIAQLHQYYRRTGSNKGWIVSFDFSDYFNTIRHDETFKLIDETFSDIRLATLIKRCVTPFGYPPQNSGMKRVRVAPNEGDYTGLSLGLGSEVSQILAVSYPNRLDNFVKHQLRAKEYGRYMDDGLLVFQDKREAQEGLDLIIQVASEKGIVINKKKTKVTKLSRGFTFLKTRFTLTDTGKVKIKLSRKNVTRQRRKLKKFAKMVAAGVMQLVDVMTSYGSWIGYALRRGGRAAVYNMNKLFRKLFGVNPPKCRLAS